ncbi:FAD-binding oxidoreductase [Roseicyclus sp. F158]|uniref:FAD-binding oxidoreductase n=1 Tax=Tropicimonas omnivorans TaxID=3075590 RepID=A0ABU3DIC7_9RHOB|nr:FAD-binding oxidoreductase [Roseicyclus sp. F158]MDT0683468.1 FAD-binding oxidoreductase [Roseicyclus sp. F158]
MSWLFANEPGGDYPESWYAATADLPEARPSLEGETRAEICVIGGGLTGLSAALHLAEAGRDVVLLEAAEPGFGASGRSGGQIGSGYNKDQLWLAKFLGEDAARQLWDLAEDAKALVRSLIERHAPEADYRPGIIHACRTEAEAEEERTYGALLARDYDYDRITPLDRAGIAAITGSPVHAGGSLDEGAGFCHPLRLTLGVARAAIAAGVRIHCRSAATRIAESRVETQGGAVTAERIVLACNGYQSGLSPELANRVLPINNFIAVTEPLGDRAPMTRPVAVADSRFVVNYWWQSGDGRLVYGGGENYGRRFPKDIASRVRANLARTYPDLEDVRFDHAWGGTLAVTATRLPFVRRLKAGLYTAGGYSGHGMALAPLSGRAIAQDILGEPAALEALSALPVPRLPGGRHLGPAITGLGLLAFALRDRTGL